MILIDDKHITNLNAEFRGLKKPTDVLTFTEIFSDEPRVGSEVDAEIYISIDTAMKQASEHNLSLVEELSLLSFHGLLHAIGYDHETSAEDAKEMRHEEAKLLQLAGLEHVQPMTN